MTVYITQGRFTGDAIKGMIARPEDRAAEVRKLIEAGGGKLLGYYITFGEYDFLLIAEGDDMLGTLAGLFTAAASGGVTDVRTTVAVSSADATTAMKKAGEYAKSFRAAGAPKGRRAAK